MISPDLIKSGQLINLAPIGSITAMVCLLLGAESAVRSAGCPSGAVTL